MADNRIYIRCKQCGAELFLGKYDAYGDSRRGYEGGGYHWEPYGEGNEHLEDRLNEFYEKHFYCDCVGNPKVESFAETPSWGEDNTYDTIFEIAYEFDGDKGKTPIMLPRIIHPNPLEWFVQFEYATGIIDSEIFYSEEKAQKRLEELIATEQK